jgi:hypothetical protein
MTFSSDCWRSKHESSDYEGYEWLQGLITVLDEKSQALSAVLGNAMIHSLDSQSAAFDHFQAQSIGL